MNDRPSEVTAADIAQLLREIDKAALRLDKHRDEVLDIEEISAATGIRPGRVRELLAGAEPEQEPRVRELREEFYRRLVSQRLDDLRKKGNPASPTGDSYRAIGSEVNLTHTLVEFLVKGRRSARPEYSSPLEKHYGVDHGFLSKLEGEALADRLTETRDALHAGALLEGLQVLGGGEVAALRQTEAAAPSLGDLVEVMDALVARKRIRDRKEAAGS